MKRYFLVSTIIYFSPKSWSHGNQWVVVDYAEGTSELDSRPSPFKIKSVVAEREKVKPNNVSILCIMEISKEHYLEMEEYTHAEAVRLQKN